MIHHMAIQGEEILHTSERPSGMTRLAGMYHPDDVPADLRTKFFEFGDSFLRHW
jgi:hypothetical protein